MLCHYEDILCLQTETSAQVQWYDEQGVPRFVEFAPRYSNKYPYAMECVLLEIECVDCHTIFNVSLARDNFQEIELSALIESNGIDYGEPPNIKCCASGPGKYARTIRVLQYWSRNYHHEDGGEWARDATKEVSFNGNLKGAQSDQSIVSGSTEPMSSLWLSIQPV